MKITADVSEANSADECLVGDFLAAMRRLAATVCLICTSDGGRPHGMSATAVMSLSAEPPALAVAVNRRSKMNGLLQPGGLFSVNLLAAAQHELAAAFGGAVNAEERFRAGAWLTDQRGVPLLQDAVASLVCLVDQRFEYASHSLIAAPVSNVLLHEGRDVLLYADGDYARLTRN